MTTNEPKTFRSFVETMGTAKARRRKAPACDDDVGGGREGPNRTKAPLTLMSLLGSSPADVIGSACQKLSGHLIGQDDFSQGEELFLSDEKLNRGACQNDIDIGEGSDHDRRHAICLRLPRARRATTGAREAFEVTRPKG
jgi:hypothetical protein